MKRILIALLILCLPCASLAGSREIRAMMGMWGASGTALSVSDNFNRANGDLTTPWVHPITDSGIYDHARIGTNIVTVDASRIGYTYYDDSFSSDQQSCVKIVGLSSSTGSYSGPAVRISTASETLTHYRVNHENGVYSIVKVVSGTPTTLVSNIGTPALNDVVCISATGSSTTSLSATINGGVPSTYDDSSSPITTGKPGFILRRGTQSPNIDNFTATDI